MAEGLATADDHREPVYLETSESRNVGYYESYGFEVMPGSPDSIGRSGPFMWRMWRPEPTRAD